jgi:hypothetical protein
MVQGSAPTKYTTHPSSRSSLLFLSVSRIRYNTHFLHSKVTTTNKLKSIPTIWLFSQLPSHSAKANPRIRLHRQQPTALLRFRSTQLCWKHKVNPRPERIHRAVFLFNILIVRFIQLRRSHGGNRYSRSLRQYWSWTLRHVERRAGRNLFPLLEMSIHLLYVSF